MGNRFYNEDEKQRLSGNEPARADEVGRSCFRKDYGRLLHAPAFRRLQGKTQLFPGSESDFFRNRLTHSLEVAHIACGIASRLNASSVKEAFSESYIDEDLVEFAAIAHDLGHPPFGHNGELALDEVMRKYGGFEGNAQTLRILTNVERKLFKDTDGSLRATCGLDLTYRSLAAVLKYDRAIGSVRPRHGKVDKGYYATEADVVSEIKRRVAPGLETGTNFQTIECAIMDIADDIAYSTYDLEDGLHAGFVSPLSLADALLRDAAIKDEVTKKTNATLVKSGYKTIQSDKELGHVIVSVFGSEPLATVQSVLDATAKTIAAGRAPARPSANQTLLINLEVRSAERQVSDNPLFRSRFTAGRIGKLINAVEFIPNEKLPQLSSVRMRREELLQVEVMKHLNYELVIRSTRLAHVEHRGKEIVQRLFRALANSDGSLLPDEWKSEYRFAAALDITRARRVVCDYVAGMTDRYALELYNRLFGDGMTIFKPL